MRNLSLLILSLFVALSAMAGSPLRIISEQEVFGEYLIYQRSNHGSAVNPETHTYYVPQNGVLEVVKEPVQPRVVFIKNIVYGSEREFGDYWVYGIENDTTHNIVVPLGQVIYEQAPDGSFIRSSRNAVLTWGTVHFDAVSGLTTFTRNLAVEKATYVAEGNTIHIEGTSGPVAIEDENNPYLNISARALKSYDATGLAIVWEGETDEWAGYLEWGTEMSTNPFIIEKQPEGVVKTYNRTSDCIHYSDYSYNKATQPTYSTEKLSDKGQIVFDYDGKTVYLKEPFLSMDNGVWIMGTLSDDGEYITVPLPQFIKSDGWYGKSMTQAECRLEPTLLPNAGSPVYAINVDALPYYNYMVYNIDGNTITLQGTWANLDAPYPDNYNASGIFFYDAYDNVGVIEANIVYVLDEDTPAEPTVKTSAPVINGNAENNGHAYRIEIVPTEPSTIYVRTLFSNSYSEWVQYDDPILFTTSGDYRIEAYAVVDGKLPSDQVYHEFSVTPSTGIDETTAGKQIASTRYFNAMGQEMQQPMGMTIVVTTYSDGTSTAVKVMK